MEFPIAVLFLVASILSSATCYPHPASRQLTDAAGSESYNLTSNYFKEPSQTHYFHPNSVYYDTKAARGSSQEILVPGPEQSSDDEKFSDKEREIGTREVYRHYTEERTAQDGKEIAPSQGKLYDALRELARTLEAIQTERYNQQQQQRKDTPPPKPETPVYNARTEKGPNFPPFTPELYPKANTGPLSILDQLGDSTGTLW